MKINYEFEVEKELLKVKAFGKTYQLEEVFTYTKAVIAKAIEHQSKKIFCDERNLNHDLDVLDTVQLAEKTKQAAPRVARVAIVYDEKDLEKGNFYETATANRGLLIFVTSNYDEAMAWLK